MQRCIFLSEAHSRLTFSFKKCTASLIVLLRSSTVAKLSVNSSSAFYLSIFLLSSNIFLPGCSKDV